MRSVSPSPSSPGFRLALVPARAWGRTRATMTAAVVWSAVIILLLTLLIAQSTATAAWVGGIGVVTAVALGGALLMGVLAVAPIPWTIGLVIGLIAGPVVAGIAAWPALSTAHPLDTLSLNLFSTWSARIADGSAGADPTFYLYLICLLMCPPDRNTCVLTILVLILARLLWTYFTTSIANATRARVRITGDARWD